MAKYSVETDPDRRKCACGRLIYTGSPRCRPCSAVPVRGGARRKKTAKKVVRAPRDRSEDEARLARRREKIAAWRERYGLTSAP